MKTIVFLKLLARSVPRIVKAFRDLVIYWISLRLHNGKAFSFEERFWKAVVAFLLLGRGPDFVIGINPRDVTDFYRQVPVLAYLPDRWVQWLIEHQWPLLCSEIKGVREVSGDGTLSGAPKRGYYVGVFFNPSMVDRHLNVRKKILHAVQFAETTAGDRHLIFGLSGWMGGVTRNGEWLVNQGVQASIATGNGNTAGIIAEMALELHALAGRHVQKPVIAFLGAAGVIGSTAAELFGKLPLSATILLVDLPKNEGRLQALREKIQASRSHPVEISVDRTALRRAQLVIVTTSSPKAVIEPGDLSPGTVVIDDSEPKNVPREVQTLRRDVLVLHVVSQIPSSIHPNFNFGVPGEEKGSLFTCMPEVFILVARRHRGHFAVGNSAVEVALEIVNWGKGHGFGLPVLYDVEGNVVRPGDLESFWQMYHNPSGTLSLSGRIRRVAPH